MNREEHEEVEIVEQRGHRVMEASSDDMLVSFFSALYHWKFPSFNSYNDIGDYYVNYLAGAGACCRSVGQQVKFF